MGCDTFVVRVGLRLFFCKNSDRPRGERQKLTKRSCCFGSQLVWSDGPCFEWSFNEHGVAIGNEALPTISMPLPDGCLGMELLAAVANARTAREGAEMVEALVAEKGQGLLVGRTVRTYDNAFLVCDASDVFVLECYGHKVSKRVLRVDKSVSISNACCATEFRHLWGDPGSGVLRAARSEFLSSAVKDPSDIFAVLRDHLNLASGKDQIEERKGPSLCLHDDVDWGTTASSVVFDVEKRLGFVSFGSPCKGVFVPVFACAASLPKDWDLFWDDVLHKQPSSIKLLRETEDLLFEQAYEFVEKSVEEQLKFMESCLQRLAQLYK